MKIDVETGSRVSEQILATAQERPPMPVVLAVAALAGPGGTDHLMAYCDASDGGTSWRVVAVARTGLITVEASSPHQEWNGRIAYDDELHDDETVHATLTPMREVVAIRVTETKDLDDVSGWRFTASWQLELRDGSQIDLPAIRRTRDNCDALIDRIRAAVAA